MSTGINRRVARCNSPDWTPDWPLRRAHPCMRRTVSACALRSLRRRSFRTSCTVQLDELHREVAVPGQALVASCTVQLTAHTSASHAARHRVRRKASPRLWCGLWLHGATRWAPAEAWATDRQAPARSCTAQLQRTPVGHRTGPGGAPDAGCKVGCRAAREPANAQ